MMACKENNSLFMGGRTQEAWHELRLIAEWIEENVKDKKLFRMHMVQFAIEHGNKPAAAKFNTTVKTVRKWRIRYEAEGYQGLKELSLPTSIL